MVSLFKSWGDSFSSMLLMRGANYLMVTYAVDMTIPTPPIKTTACVRCCWLSACLTSPRICINLISSSNLLTWSWYWKRSSQGSARSSFHTSRKRGLKSLAGILVPCATDLHNCTDGRQSRRDAIIQLFLSLWHAEPRDITLMFDWVYFSHVWGFFSPPGKTKG